MSHAIPLCVATVLAISAALKTHALWLASISHLGAIPLPRWVSVAGVGMEVAIAVVLILSWRPRLVQGLTLALFAGFALIAAWLAFTGAASCGCFGRLTVPPWATLILDLGVVGALAWNLRRMPRLPIAEMLGHWRPATAAACGLAFATILLVHRPNLGASIQQAVIVTGSRLEAQATERIDAGNWIVVCYRSDCPHCTTAIGEWLDWAALDQENNGRRWAFLNVDEPDAGKDLLDRFPQAKAIRWRKPMPYLTTPLVLELRAGVVARTSESVEEFFAALPADGQISQTVSRSDQQSP